MSNDDRAFMLRWIYEIEGAQPETVKKSVRKLRLKGWSDFPDAYPSAPLGVKLFRKE
jgi:hypothetical protein